MKVYLDNVIASAWVLSDLEPPAEMAAVEGLREYERRGQIEVVTSRESWREQERTQDAASRQRLLEARSDLQVVPYDHEIFGFTLMQDRRGGFIANPSVTELIDQALFDDLKARGLEDDPDARHLMYAVCNGGDRSPHLEGWHDEDLGRE